MPRVQLDGGYYTRAPDNLPLIGPMPGAPAGARVACCPMTLNPNPHPNPHPAPEPECNTEPKPKPGAYVCAGLSGYGVMAANAAGELLASHVARDALGDSLYADDFLPERWSREEYKGRVASGAADKGLQI